MGGRLCAHLGDLARQSSDRTFGPLSLRVDDLRTPDSHELARSSVHFDPPVVDEFAAGSSRVVGVTVTADRRLAPGIYRGIIQSMGAPAFSLALHVDVEDPEP